MSELELFSKLLVNKLATTIVKTRKESEEKKRMTEQEQNRLLQQITDLELVTQQKAELETLLDTLILATDIDIEDTYNETQMLIGNVNRMCMCNTEKELVSMYQWANMRLGKLLQLNLKRLQNRR